MAGLVVREGFVEAEGTSKVEHSSPTSVKSLRCPMVLVVGSCGVFLFFVFNLKADYKLNCLLTDQITEIPMVDALVDPSNRPVDLVSPVASLSTFYKMGDLFLLSTSWRRKFEGRGKLFASLKCFQ